MAFPADKLLVRVEAAPGADLTGSPGSWPWVDISAYARGRVAIHRGREDTYSVVGESTCTLRLANEDSRFTFNHPLGAYWPDWRRGTPIRVSVNPGSGWVTRFVGELRQCDPVWPAGTSDVAEVQVEAKGRLHRLGRGKALDSPLKRLLLRDQAIRPVAYWAMEDESGAETFGPTVGSIPMTFNDMQPAGDSTIPGSAPLPKAGAAAWLHADVPAYPAADRWAVAWAMRLPSPPTASTVLMWWFTEGDIRTWALWLEPGTPDTLVLRGYDINNTQVSGGGTYQFTVNGSAPYGQPLYFRATGRQSGSNILTDVRATSPDGNTPSAFSTAFTATLGNLSHVSHAAAPGLAAGYTIGHIAAATSVSFASTFGQVAGGFIGESARDRWLRLGAEEKISVDTASAEVGESLGAQQRATLLELLRQVEAADGGLIWEKTDGTLAMRVHTDRYNRTPTLALDVVKGHVKLPFLPAGDDQRLRNEVVVSRIGGGEARYSDIDVRDGTITASMSLGYADDARLPYRAQWEVHRGTAEDLRIPSLPINLQSTPDLISQWLATDIGDWLTVDNLPVQYPPGQAGLVLEGHTETFDAVTWSADLGVSPSRPWEVFEIGHDRLGRLDTAGSQLAAGVSATATSLSVTTTTGPQWITTAGQPSLFPFDIEISGIRLRVTAITGTTFTVTRSMDGFDKPLPAGSDVRLWRPGVWAL